MADDETKKTAGESASPSSRSSDWADGPRSHGGAKSKIGRSRDVPLGPALLPAARRRGARLFPMLALASAASITLVVAAWAVSGSGDADDSKTSPQAEVASAEKRIAELEQEQKRREDALAELERRKNAKESELADASERVEGLEKRRADVQKQIAELTAPISPSGNERVQDYAGGEPIAADDAAGDDPKPEIEARSAARHIPIPRPAPLASKASVDAGDAGAPMDDGAASNDERLAARERSEDRSDADATPPAAPDEVADAPAKDDPTGAMAERAATGPLRVFIHVRASDRSAIERAKAVAAELRKRGVTVAQIRGVPYPVSRDSVRFFYDADRAAVPELQKAIRDVSRPSAGEPTAQDFRSYGAPPKQGTMELWLS